MTDQAKSPPKNMDGAPLQRLSAILDTILPASEDGTMPSAGEMDFSTYLHRQAPDYLDELKWVADQVGDDFPTLSLSERVTFMRDFAASNTRRFNDLVFKIYDCYYQDSRVRALIGARPGAPFPGGNVIIPGDLSSLDTVTARAKGYRRV